MAMQTRRKRIALLNLVWFLIMVLTVGLSLLSAYQLLMLDQKLPCTEPTALTKVSAKIECLCVWLISCRSAAGLLGRSVLNEQDRIP